MSDKHANETNQTNNNFLDDVLFIDLFNFLRKHISLMDFNREDLYDALIKYLNPVSIINKDKSLLVKGIIDNITENLNRPNNNKIVDRILNDRNNIIAIYKKHNLSIDTDSKTIDLLTELIYYCISKYTRRFAPHYSSQQHKSITTTKGRENDAKVLWNMLKTCPKIIVSGELGSGKSHFIKYCLKTWDIKDYFYINYDNNNDIKTNLHQIKYTSSFGDIYMGSSYELMNNSFASSLLVIDDMLISPNMSSELKWLSELNINIIILTISPIKNDFFQLYELPRLTDNNLLQIFLEESGLSISDGSLLKSLLTLTMNNTLMVSLIARQCKNKIKRFPDESHSSVLKDVLESLEYPDTHLRDSAGYQYKHESTGYNKTLNILGHIKTIYNQSFENAAPTLHEYMKWLSCFGNSPLPLEFIPFIIPEYDMEALEALHDMGLITLADGYLQLSALVSHAAFAVEISSPIEKDLKDLPDSLLAFLKDYDRSLSVPYLSNSLLTFMQAIYKRIPHTTNRKGQEHTSKEFEKWQTLIYLVYNYYNQNGDFFIARKLVSSIHYPAGLTNGHSFLDAKFFHLGNNLQLIYSRMEMISQIDELYSYISQYSDSISITDISYFLINAIDLIINLFCWTTSFKLASNGQGNFDRYQRSLILSMNELLEYITLPQKDTKTCISEDALQYYQYINLTKINPIYSFEFNLEPIKRWENKNYRIRGLAFILLMQSLNIHWSCQNMREPLPFISYVSEINYLSCQIRECRLIPYETFRLCFYLYISTAIIQRTLNSICAQNNNPIHNISILNSIKELISRSYLSKDEIDKANKKLKEIFPPSF